MISHPLVKTQVDDNWGSMSITYYQHDDTPSFISVLVLNCRYKLLLKFIMMVGEQKYNMWNTASKWPKIHTPVFFSSPSCHALRSYGPHLGVTDHIWGDDW